MACVEKPAAMRTFVIKAGYKISKPNITAMLDESDCALLIGDPALMIEETNGEMRKFDLVETWKVFTGFGFVFAMWMANKDKAGSAKTINFSTARDEGLSHIDEIISNYESQISLERDDFKKYLSENISYSISNSMQKGLELYYELAEKHGLIERNKPLRFL